MIKFITKSRFLKPIAGFIHKIWMDYKYGVVVYYNDQGRLKVIKLVRQIKKEVDLLLGDNEAYTIYRTIMNTAKIKGDIAEVGTYQGGSSKIICEAKDKKALHLFDTFEGLPELSKFDDTRLVQKGDYSASLVETKRYLKKYNKIHFYKGLFPSTSGPVRNRKFSFVNLDADLFMSTLSSLKFFYPRMTKGGIIISHDYTNVPGVKKAVDEFFADKTEPVVELSGSQCLIVKT